MAQSITELVTKYANMAAGTYREIIDGTSEPRLVSSNNVVVVGQFEKGPVMRPVYVRDPEVAHTIFGPRSNRLEAKGCFGMLMAEHVLEQGPIWILNIKNISAHTETLQVKQLAVNNEETDQLVDETISTVFDTTKFWKIDPMYGIHGDSPSVLLASVAEGKVTVVIEKYNSDNYNYTIAETKQYNEDFQNEALDDNDFVNDYLVRIHVFNCDLNSAKLSVPNAFVNGQLNLSAIEDIQNDKNSKYFATYTGTIGDVIDINGNNLNIVTKINADTNASGLYMALNRDSMLTYGVDLIGKQSLVFTGDAMPTTKEISRLGYAIQPTLKEQCLHMSALNPKIGYMFGTANVAAGDVLANEDKYVRVLSKNYVDNVYSLPEGAVLGTAEYPVQPSGEPFVKNSVGSVVYPSTSPKAGQPVEVDQNQKVLWFFNAFTEINAAWKIIVGELAVGAHVIKLNYILNGVEAQLQETAASNSGADIKAAIDAMLTIIADNSDIEFTSVFTDAAGDDPAFITISTTSVPKGLGQFTIDGARVDDEAIDVTKSGTEPTVASNISTVQSAPITVADGNVTFEGETNPVDIDACKSMYGVPTAVYEIMLSEAMDSKILTGHEITPTNGGVWGQPQIITVAGSTFEATPYCFMKLVRWYDMTTTCTAHAIQGIVSLEKHYVNGTAARQKQILDRLTDNWCVTSFSDPTIFRCRYMVDSFKTYIEPNAKYQYATLADKSARFLVFIPAPFYYELRNSKNPDFKDLLGDFQMSYVANGSNPDKPSTNSFFYARSGDKGRYLYPIMNVNYNIGFGDKTVPATGAIAKLFYSKLTGVNKVYDIVAGADWPLGAAGITGPEFESGPEDRAAMERMGTNVIQVVEGILQVRSSKTAYQTVLSAFNYPETMEKCFFVADNVESTLNGKLFKYNNADARLAVKKRADSVCDIMVADGVIADYDNKCDLDNNPVEVRKNRIIVLDTTLYNEYGIAIAVHRITVKDPEQ